MRSQYSVSYTNWQEQILKKRGIDIHTSVAVQGVTVEGETCTCHYIEKEKEQEVTAEYVLCAVGRCPNTDGLFGENVKPDMERGRVLVNENLESSIPGVYAIGDLIFGAQLAHAASAQGMVVAEKLAGKEPSIDIARDAIKEVLNFNQPISVTINNIINNVGNTFGISPENIMSDKRDKNIKDARQVSMYIIREITGMKLVDIGNVFNGKTHSTVNHSIEVIEDRMNENPVFKKTVEDIIKNMQEF